MPTYNLTVELESPLSIAPDQGTAFQQQTLSYVPPTTLRGGLAALALYHTSADDAGFQEAFVQEKLRVSSLLPVPPRSNPASVQVAPLTLLSCKQHPGFREDEDNASEGHGIEDALFAQIAFGLREDTGPLQALRTCPHCGNVLRPLGGHIYRNRDGTYARSPALSKRIQDHVGLDRRRHGAASGILFSREVLSEQMPIRTDPEVPYAPTRLQGTIDAPENVLSWLRAWLKPGVTLTLGQAVSRGLGRCRVAGFEMAPPPPPIQERIDAFNQRLQTYHPEAEYVYVSLTLLTPALFIDAFLRPNMTPGARDLLQEARAEERSHQDALANLEVVYQTTRPYQRIGWNGLAGFPRTPMQGLQAGSVLLLRAQALDETVLAALAHIEAAGIGLERGLGFGRVRVCDPLHTGVHEMTEPSTLIINPLAT